MSHNFFAYLQLPHSVRLVPRRAWAHALMLAVAAAALAPSALVDPSRGQSGDERRTTRQVTAFGLRAEPGVVKLDPMLSPQTAAPLRKLLPDHGFELLGASNERLDPGQALGCSLSDGRLLKVALLDAIDADGKVHLRVQLLAPGRDRPVFVTDVRTPPNQLLFLDKQIDDSDALLLIGVGAR